MVINKINALLSSASGNIGFYCQNKSITIKTFAQIVKYYYLIAIKSDSHRAILYCDDIFHFFIGFFALLCAGKEVILPSHYYAGITQELGIDLLFVDSQLDDAAIVIRSDVECDEKIALPKISNDAKIIFYTSGSTGAAKQIHKRFANLAAETIYLTELFNDTLSQKPVVVSTVNVNHMYGIFYQFLVPLYNDLIIDTTLVRTPERLNGVLQQYDKVFLVSSPAFLKRISRFVTEYTFAKKPIAITSAGGGLDKSCACGISHQLGSYPIEIFGSTETGGVAHKNQEIAEYWTLFAPVKACIGENNRLLVESPFIDKPFQMDDNINFINEQQFILLSRADRIVKFEEKRVSLPELETLLLSDTFIHEAHVSLIESDERKFLGACIVLTAKGKRELIANGRKELINRFKSALGMKIDRICIPSKWRFIEELPQNNQGKILKSDIVNVFHQHIAEPVVICKSITENEIALTLVFLGDSFYFQGHFPQHAILPGVAQIHFAMHWIKRYFEHDITVDKISRLKFTNIIKPNAEISFKVSRMADGFDFKYYVGENIYSSGRINV